MTVTNVSQLRNLLDTFMHSIAKSGELPSTKELVVAFRKKHKAAIDSVSQSLEDMALTKLVAQVGDRKRDPIPDEDQGDLFGHYPGIPDFIVIPVAQQNQRKSHRVLFSNATVGEVGSWVKEGGRNVQPRRIKQKGVIALLRDIEPFAGSPETTIKDAYQAMVAAKSKAA